MKRPVLLYVLIFWLVFLALGGLYGGILMLRDPSGGLLQMDFVLPMLPVPDYTLPGLFLIGVMGLAPLLLAYALLARPHWQWLEALARPVGYYWAWMGTLLLGGILVVWLAVQGALIGFRWPIQYVTAVNAAAILVFTLLPPVRQFYIRLH